VSCKLISLLFIRSIFKINKQRSAREADLCFSNHPLPEVKLILLFFYPFVLKSLIKISHRINSCSDIHFLFKLMKKHFFFKEYIYYNEFESRTTGFVSLLDVDYEQIERELPTGAKIKLETVQTVVEAGKFIVYGEYSMIEASLSEMVSTDAIELTQVLGEEGILPSAN
jgi:hypothetical protein